MPAYILYRKFLKETDLPGCVHTFNIWREYYAELVLFEEGSN